MFLNNCSSCRCFLTMKFVGGCMLKRVCPKMVGRLNSYIFDDLELLNVVMVIIIYTYFQICWVPTVVKCVIKVESLWKMWSVMQRQTEHGMWRYTAECLVSRYCDVILGSWYNPYIAHSQQFHLHFRSQAFLHVNDIWHDFVWLELV